MLGGPPGSTEHFLLQYISVSAHLAAVKPDIYVVKTTFQSLSLSISPPSPPPLPLPLSFLSSLPPSLPLSFFRLLAISFNFVLFLKIYFFSFLNSLPLFHIYVEQVIHICASTVNGLL